jgi:hypothetical protein
MGVRNIGTSRLAVTCDRASYRAPQDSSPRLMAWLVCQRDANFTIWENLLPIQRPHHQRLPYIQSIIDCLSTTVPNRIVARLALQRSDRQYSCVS